MKILQEQSEERWQFTSFAEMRGVIRRSDHPSEVILLLHGLGERGKRIFRKLISHLPQDAIIIAPDAPFPLQRPKEGRIAYGFTWYFYDKFEQKYFVNQDLAKFWLRDLLQIENPNKLPVTIIGFSQGGYLAPLVGNEVPETKLIIGLACEFRTTLIHEKPAFPLVAIHGEKDEVIKIESALAEIEKLKSLDMKIEMYRVKDAAHEITREMGLTVKATLESYGNRSL